MKNKFIALLILLPFLVLAQPEKTQPVSPQVQELQKSVDKAREKIMSPQSTKYPIFDPTVYVNPFIGTGGHGHTFPGPVLPFGMVQLGPDTRHEGWDGCGGYHYSDSVIYGFSHTHLSGVGVPDYGDILIVPQVGKVATEPIYTSKNGYGAGFSHTNEIAKPGFYSVKLDNGIDVRLTATQRCGIHEYTFANPNGKKFIVIDLGYRDKTLEAKAISVSKTEVRGMRRSSAWAQNQHIYFDLQSSTPFTKATWEMDSTKNKYVLVLEYPSTTLQIMLKVGISGTDETGAKNNLDAEAGEWDFETYLRNSSVAWRNELSAIKATAGDKNILTNFYTALYHTYIHPSVWTDVDGRYRDFNSSIQQSKTGDLYSVFSLWDTYRAANPLYTILQPKRTTAFIESFRQQYTNTGLLPVWTLSNNETNCMIGYHAASVIADASAKGIKLNAPEQLLEAMQKTSNFNQFGKLEYANQGFISAQNEAESVSKTLEYAYDDWCISQFAKQMNGQLSSDVYSKRAANWLNVFNPESGFFQPRKGALWLSNFKPSEVNHHFTEANAWQYSLAAPHHLQSLIGLKGGKKSMESFLDSLFGTNSSLLGREQADITGLIGQYAHGNEPSHHLAYVYNYAGAPYKTQLYTDSIMKTYYTNAPDGLSGNEDCGQMSAWYVFNAMGFYPVCPGLPTYAIGRPLLPKVEIKTGDKSFIVQTLNNSSTNKYIQTMRWNGESYTKLYITHEMLLQGGILEITMGSTPNFELADYELDIREKINPMAVAVPYFVAKSTTFSDSIAVVIDRLPNESGAIFYRIGESDFQEYKANEKPILLFESAIVSAYVHRELNAGIGELNSPIVSTAFTKYQQNKRIELKTKYANQYAGGGEQALVDGQKGNEEYRGTEWQGFQGEDVVGIITLDDVKSISKVSVSALQDTRSWIFFPKQLVVEASVDGINYKIVGTENYKKLAQQEEPASITTLSLDLVPTPAKYVRVTVKNFGNCPVWHLGAGGKTWLFLDEIEVE